MIERTDHRALPPHGTIESRPQYRPDVDGLRAIAILPVVLYHAQVGFFTGGYIGVDVFFVISGFLITGLIVRELEGSGFSIATFYERRVRRIWPALVFIVGLICILSVLLLTPDQLASFGKNVLALPLFASNILFWRQSGYFDKVADSNLLLHTWSLAVEEQFYLAFPLVLLLMHRRVRIRYTSLLAVAAALSFGLSTALVTIRPAAVFYLAPPRAWELLVGGLIALGVLPAAPRRAHREAAATVGLVMIAWSAWTYSASTTFPGPSALIPTFGAALVIHAGMHGESFAKRILSANPLVAIGLVSYSLYLWHWPLLVLLNALTLGSAVWQRWMVVGASMCLAFGTHILIEKPILKRRLLPGPLAMLIFASSSAVALAGFGITVVTTHGLPQRFNDTTQRVLSANATAKRDWQYPTECQANFLRHFAPSDTVYACTPIGRNPKTVLFWGDSQVEQLFPAVRDLAEGAQLGGLGAAFVTSGGCPPIPDLIHPDAAHDCAGFNTAALARALQPDVRTVVFGSLAYEGAGWRRRCRERGCSDAVSINELADFAEAGFTKTLRSLTHAGKRVVVILPFPAYPFSPPDYLNRAVMLKLPPSFQLTREQYLIASRTFRDILLRSALAASANVIDPADVYCSTTCSWREGLASLYKDANHLTAVGARKMGKPIASALGGND